MKQRELIDYCTNPKNRCDACPYDAECDIYFDMYGTSPACEENNHPERYTDDDIGLIDGELTIKDQIIQLKRGKGKWIPHKSKFGGPGEKVYTCNKCGYNIGFRQENYCPHCGADMRGE